MNWRERIGLEFMHQNAHLSREDGYRYPRCDLEDKPGSDDLAGPPESANLPADLPAPAPAPEEPTASKAVEENEQQPG
jgi:hypothetical protein